jgi:hypothetical protein
MYHAKAFGIFLSTHFCFLFFFFFFQYLWFVGTYLGEINSCNLMFPVYFVYNKRSNYHNSSNQKKTKDLTPIEDFTVQT